eukprot:GILI01004885.1.p1 GENE.GILI01004885.1~~GILI01004885.1.p1  ORF type:complete len:589 (-),score=199.63 GILI01004885.1:1410-3176(-)
MSGNSSPKLNSYALLSSSPKTAFSPMLARSPKHSGTGRFSPRAAEAIAASFTFEETEREFSAFDLPPSATASPPLNKEKFARPASPPPASAPLLDEKTATRKDQILSGYLYGQLGNVGKMAVWWSVFTPLIMSMFDDEDAVGTMRVAFNLALMFLSPLAGCVAERVSVKKLLNVTTTIRLFVWVVFVPAAWVVLKSDWVPYCTNSTAFYIVMLLLLFLDGSQVAVSNVVDIDCGGLDLLGQQHGAEVTDVVRNKFNSTHQIVFDSSFIVFTPIIGYLMYAMTQHLGTQSEFVAGLADVTGILGGMMAVFLVLSIVSLYNYNRFIPDLATSLYPHADLPLSTQARMIFHDMRDGIKICLSNGRIGWRLTFLAIETALEDAMVSVLICFMALNAPTIFADKDHTAEANLWAAVIIAIGKIGALCSGFFMNKFWVVPTESQIGRYTTLFWSVFLGGSVSLLFPAALILVDMGYFWVARLTVFAASFFFFLFSTAPKIGFATLLQGLAAEEESSGKIFGFVGTFVTAMDALVIMAMTLIFTSTDSVLTAFWVCSGIYVGHGLLEVLFGPCLILRGKSRKHSASQPLLVNVGN